MPDAEQIHRRNVSYYDHIAGQYNDILKKERSNEIIREKVAEKFREIVGDGLVLDFGGGTGVDLDWLTRYNKVIFSEPSSGMREIALCNHGQNPSVIFLDAAKTDFKKWDHDLPFRKKWMLSFAILPCSILFLISLSCSGTCP